MKTAKTHNIATNECSGLKRRHLVGQVSVLSQCDVVATNYTVCDILPVDVGRLRIIGVEISQISAFCPNFRSNCIVAQIWPTRYYAHLTNFVSPLFNHIRSDIITKSIHFLTVAFMSDHFSSSLLQLLL